MITNRFPNRRYLVSVEVDLRSSVVHARRTRARQVLDFKPAFEAPATPTSSWFYSSTSTHSPRVTPATSSLLTANIQDKAGPQHNFSRAMPAMTP